VIVSACLIETITRCLDHEPSQGKVAAAMLSLFPYVMELLAPRRPLSGWKVRAASTKGDSRGGCPSVSRLLLDNFDCFGVVGVFELAGAGEIAERSLIDERTEVR
jgi:hypothetical protein